MYIVVYIYLYIYTYMYIFLVSGKATRATKNAIKQSKNRLKDIIKDRQSLHTNSNLILPRLAKFEEIWSNSTGDMDL